MKRQRDELAQVLRIDTKKNVMPVHLTHSGINTLCHAGKGCQHRITCIKHCQMGHWSYWDNCYIFWRYWSAKYIWSCALQVQVFLSSHTHIQLCVYIHISYFSSCTWPMSLFDCFTGFYCVEFQLSSPTRKMCSSKLHKFIQVSGFQVKASPLQSPLLQGNTPKDATSNCLLMSFFFLIYHIVVCQVKVGLGRWNSSFRSDNTLNI